MALTTRAVWQSWLPSPAPPFEGWCRIPFVLPSSLFYTSLYLVCQMTSGCEFPAHESKPSFSVISELSPIGLGLLFRNTALRVPVVDRSGSGNCEPYNSHYCKREQISHVYRLAPALNEYSHYEVLGLNSPLFVLRSDATGPPL